MTVVSKDGVIQAWGFSAIRVDAQGEHDLIKVQVEDVPEGGFFYIGTNDRDTYILTEVNQVPDGIWNDYMFDINTKKFTHI